MKVWQKQTFRASRTSLKRLLGFKQRREKMEAMLTGNKMTLGWTKFTWSLGITSWQEIIATKQDLKLVLDYLRFQNLRTSIVKVTIFYLEKLLRSILNS